MFSGKQVIRRVEKGVGRAMLNAEVIYHLTQGAAEPGVFSDSAESQSSSRSLLVAFSLRQSSRRQFEKDGSGGRRGAWDCGPAVMREAV
jgi:hypothetical protein